MGTDVDVTQALPNLQGAEYRAATVELVDRAKPTRPIDQAVGVDRDPPNVRPVQITAQVDGLYKQL